MDTHTHVQSKQDINGDSQDYIDPNDSKKQQKAKNFIDYIFVMMEN